MLVELDWRLVRWQGQDSSDHRSARTGSVMQAVALDLPPPAQPARTN